MNELTVKGPVFTVRYSVALDERIVSVDVEGRFIEAVTRRAAQELRAEAEVWGVREMVTIVAHASAPVPELRA